MSLELAFQAQGDTGSPVIVMHGLFGAARNWTRIAKRLGKQYRVFALDLRNHGGSPWSDEVGYAAMAEDVRAFIENLDLEPVIAIGHSMGGKVAMRLALEYRDLIDRLIVADVAPVPYEHSFDDYFDAMRGVDLAEVKRRADVEAALEPSIPEPGIRAFLLQNLVRDGRGFAWQVNLDALAMQMDDITGWPDDLPGRRFDGPTLFVGGDKSDYLKPRERSTILKLFPEARFMTLKNAGHWLHAEQPEAFIATVHAFLEQT
jgi:esterase